MDADLANEVLDELLPSLEALETQSSAILQFLKDKGVATDEQLAPYLEQAGNASNVRWRATRLRMERVLSSAIKPFENAMRSLEKAAAKSSEPAAETGTTPQKSPEQRSSEHVEEKAKKAGGKQRVATSARTERTVEKDKARKADGNQEATTSTRNEKTADTTDDNEKKVTVGKPAKKDTT